MISSHPATKAQVSSPEVDEKDDSLLKQAFGIRIGMKFLIIFILPFFYLGLMNSYVSNFSISNNDHHQQTYYNCNNFLLENNKIENKMDNDEETKAKNQEQENSFLQQEIDRLKHLLEEKTSEKKDLEERYRDTQSQLVDLQKANGDLKKENEELNAEYHNQASSEIEHPVLVNNDNDNDEEETISNPERGQENLRSEHDRPVLVKNDEEESTSNHEQDRERINETPLLSYMSKMEEIKMKHPHCFSNDLFQDSKGYSMDISARRKLKGLNSVGKYKLIGRDVAENSSIRYNHLCPYIRKDRYNCARNDTDILDYGQNPTDWKLVLTPPMNVDDEHGKSDTTGSCNLWNLIHDIGGPAGVADGVLELQQQAAHHRKEYGNSTDDTMPDDKISVGDAKGQSAEKRPYIVLIAGNSHLRQVFEAAACGWSNDVTDYRGLTKAKLCESMACMNQMKEDRGRYVYYPDEIGEVVSLLDRVKTSCYVNDTCVPDQSRNASFREGVVLPTDVFGEEVSDTIAMVEFAGKMQIYNMFHPEKYDNVTDVFMDELGLDLADVDFFIRNDAAIKVPRKMQQILQSTGVWQTQYFFGYISDKFGALQKRDIGRWFGADNPWIFHPPDGHACLPGPPDDAMNLILFLILSNAYI